MFLKESSLIIPSLNKVWDWICVNFTVANLITLLGFYLTWEMVILRRDGVANILTFLLLGGAAATDKLDGLAAWFFDEATPLGSALDKLRDKALILLTGFFVYQSYRSFYLISLEIKIIAAIEIFLLLIGAIISLSGAKLRANEFGRWKMGFECAAVICWAMFNDLHLCGFSINNTLPLRLIFVLLSTSLTLALASTHGQIKDNWLLIKRVAMVIRSYY